MARRGRKPAPAALRRLRGTRPRAGRAKLVALPGMPTMPRGMTPAARRTWRATVEALGELGLLTSCDAGLVARHAQLSSLYTDSLATLATDGLTVQNDNRRVTHPAARLLLTLASELRAIERELGLSPRARDGLDEPAPESIATPGVPSLAEWNAQGGA